MRISLHTLGTRGDVQPFIALACALKAKGHEVQLGAPSQFAALAAARNIDFAELPGGFLDLLDSPEGKAAVAAGQGFSAGFKLLKYVGPLMQDLMQREWAVARAFQPDVIVAHPKSIAMPHIAGALGKPFVLASPIPGFTPTRAYPSPMLPFANLGPLNRASHGLMTNSADVLFAKPIRDWREHTLMLPPRGKPPKPATTLYAYSRHLLSRPSDFPPSVHVTGFWFLDTPQYEPPERLRSFLEAGDPPVAVGFGSMPGLDPVQLTTTVTEGLARAGKRGLLVGAGGSLVDRGLSETCLFIEQAPYDWLFERVSSTLHHGGAGTTASSLRAGKPIIACPFMADQPFWARQIESVGLGPRALDRRRLTPERLASAVIEADRAEIQSRAKEVAWLISQEGGVEEAAQIISEIRPQPV